jgi:uncharacterized membrane protein
MNDLPVNSLETILGRVLGVGVAASSICLALGLLLTLTTGGSGAARTLLTVGIVLLLATPIVRVAVSSAGYAHRREWLFVVLTLVVLAQLIATIVAALAR